MEKMFQITNQILNADKSLPITWLVYHQCVGYIPDAIIYNPNKWVRLSENRVPYSHRIPNSAHWLQ